jgi:hypothetical protein
VDVEVLAADHPVDARGGGELAQGPQDVGRLAGLVGEDVAEGLGVEAVAGEDRDVLPVGDVARGAPAPQVVVVHRGQVVVDERVRVDELDRRRQRQDLVGVAAQRARRGEGQDGRIRLPPARRE